MASRVELFEVAVPAGTAVAAAILTATRFDEGDVETVEVVVPPGPSGQVGFAILHGGGRVFPRESNRWIITDDEKITWHTSNLPDAGDWAVEAYNTGVYDHTLYVRFLVSETGSRPPPAPVTLNITQANQPTTTTEPATTGSGEGL